MEGSSFETMAVEGGSEGLSQARRVHVVFVNTESRHYRGQHRVLNEDFDIDDDTAQ